MNASVQRAAPPNNTPFWLAYAFLGGSILIHVVGFYFLSRWAESRPLDVAKKPVELTFFEVEKPKPPPPEPEVPKVEEVKPPPVKLKVKPPPVKVAEQKAPPPPVDLPPPPNDAPPPETPTAKPVIITGISLSSTTAGGAFAAPVGNTMYGKNPTQAADPADVRAYSAPKYVPPSQVDEMATLSSEVKVPYPEEARREGIEGAVIMRIIVGADGQVLSAKLLKGPGFGLNEAALSAIKRFKFKPATKNGEKVSTELDYTYRFTLD